MSINKSVDGMDKARILGVREYWVIFIYTAYLGVFWQLSDVRPCFHGQESHGNPPSLGVVPLECVGTSSQEPLADFEVRMFLRGGKCQYVNR